MTHSDVLILGGGWAGLWSACALARTGLSVRLLERRDILGGRAVTDGPPGYRLNLGAHALYRKGAARAALAEVGIHPAGALPATRGLHALLGDRTLALPTGLTSLMTTPLLEGRARWALLSGLSRLMRADLAPLAGRPIGPWLDELVPHPRARAVVSTLLRLTTYADDESHLDAVAGVAQLRLGLRGNVMYLHEGWGAVVSALHARAVAEGADVHVGVTAERLIADRDGFTVHTSAGPMTARAVIVATPPEAARKLLPSLDAKLAPEVLRPVRAAALDVALSRLPVPSHRLALGIDRPLYFSVASAVAHVAPPGAAAIHLVRYGGAGPEGEAELDGVLDRLQPGWRDHVVWRRYLPRITVAHALACADRPRPEASGVDGVYLAGDWVGPRGMLADAALASARVAVEAVRARLEVDASTAPDRARGERGFA